MATCGGEMEPQIAEFETPAACSLVALVREAFRMSLVDRSGVDPGVLAIDGMSGRRYRHFINNLIGMIPDAHYLEIGTWSGSTLCAAINGNAVKATAIDNWSQFHAWAEIGGPKTMLKENLKRFRTGQAYVSLIESDFRAVDYGALGPFNVYLFDGPHDRIDQYDGLRLPQPCLEQDFVYIVDDWNWASVRNGTRAAIESVGVTVLYSLEIRSSLDDSHPTPSRQDSDWHNGYCIAVLRKPA
jgi:hypothetical protein